MTPRVVVVATMALMFALRIPVMTIVESRVEHIAFTHGDEIDNIRDVLSGHRPVVRTVADGRVDLVA